MTLNEAYIHIKIQLQTVYDAREAANISDRVLEHISGLKKIDRLIDKNKRLDSSQIQQLYFFLERLLQNEPVQYVLGKTWFAGLKFYVDKNVFIPRPETEELVDWIISDCKLAEQELKILDIGTGSGCIPVSLKRKLQKAEAWALDVSEAALSVAKRNAKELAVADINFIHFDFLDEEQRKSLPSFDIIVSNPPYIPLRDKKEMNDNVVKFEPEKSLFVPDNDPLIFYFAIADFGKEKLNSGGSIYVEIHESLGEAVVQLLKSAGYNSVDLKKDMQGKDRMVRIRN